LIGKKHTQQGRPTLYQPRRWYGVYETPLAKRISFYEHLLVLLFYLKVRQHRHFVERCNCTEEAAVGILTLVKALPPGEQLDVDSGT
jgi:hypothetical protein